MIPEWHAVVFQTFPILAAVGAFFLTLRSRLDKAEVRLSHIELEQSRVAEELADKSSIHECENVHKQIDKRLESIEKLSLQTLAHIVNLPAKIKNGGGNYGDGQ